MARPGETIAEWEQRVRRKYAGVLSATAYVWCPWCKTRARGFRQDGRFMAWCSRCGKTWRRHKR